MQIALSKFGWNSFQSSTFTFVQLSPLSFKFIQFRFFVQFSLKKLFSQINKKNL